MNILHSPAGRNWHLPTPSVTESCHGHLVGFSATRLFNVKPLVCSAPPPGVWSCFSWKACVPGRFPCLQVSRLRSTASDNSSFQVQEDLQWLTEELRSELVNGGLDNEESLKIGEACAKACQRFFGPGYGPCDPMVIMDAMEEEIERRDLRGDFLPFELARKALLVLQRRWQGPRRPSQFLQPKENRLDVVNFEKLPKPK